MIKLYYSGDPVQVYVGTEPVYVGTEPVTSGVEDAEESLGGPRSYQEVSSVLYHELTTAQFINGANLFRCLYVESTEAQSDVSVWISSDTPGVDTTVYLGWGQYDEDTQIADETLSPDNVIFDTAPSADRALSGGSFNAGQIRALWIKYNIVPSEPVSPESFTLQFEKS